MKGIHAFRRAVYQLRIYYNKLSVKKRQPNKTPPKTDWNTVRFWRRQINGLAEQKACVSNRQCVKNSIRNALIIPKIKNKISTKNCPEVRVEKKKKRKAKCSQYYFWRNDQPYARCAKCRADWLLTIGPYVYPYYRLRQIACLMMHKARSRPLS